MTVGGVGFGFLHFLEIRNLAYTPIYTSTFLSSCQPLVNLSSPLPFPSIYLLSLHSPFPNPTFIQLSPHTHSSLIPHSHILFPLNTYPQLIHNSHTSYPQLFHRLSTTPILLIDLSSILLFPLIWLILQSSPLYFLLYPHPKLSTGTLSYPQVIHNLVYLSTGYPQIYPTYLTFKPTLILT